MSMMRKMLFSAPDNGRDLEGLVAMLRKTSPGGMAELADRGGRLGGQPMADDDESDRRTDANLSRIRGQQKKC